MSDGRPVVGYLKHAARLARAKVNLGLAMAGRRQDGYHELRSVFLRINLADRLTASIDADSAVDRLSVDADEECPVDGNTVLRGVSLLRRGRFATLPPLNLRLEKCIPLAAGLGGGSSDAAAAISLAAEVWWLSLKHTEIVALGAQIGADVPFFAENLPAALIGGIGDQIEPLPAIHGEPGVLLVTPKEGLGTAAVFAELDRLAAQPGSGEVVGELAAAFRTGLDGPALAAWAPLLRDANDLWPAAVSLQPSLERLRSELERALDRPFLLSGSGSTLFALYPFVNDARDAGATLVAKALPQLAGARMFATGTNTGTNTGTAIDIEEQAWRIQ